MNHELVFLSGLGPEPSSIDPALQCITETQIGHSFDTNSDFNHLTSKSNSAMASFVHCVPGFQLLLSQGE